MHIAWFFFIYLFLFSISMYFYCLILFLTTIHFMFGFVCAISVLGWSVLLNASECFRMFSCSFTCNTSNIQSFIGAYLSKTLGHCFTSLPKKKKKAEGLPVWSPLMFVQDLTCVHLPKFSIAVQPLLPFPTLLCTRKTMVISFNRSAAFLQSCQWQKSEREKACLYWASWLHKQYHNLCLGKI